MRAVRASRLLLTHFGPHTWVDDLLTQLEGWLDAREQFARQIAAAGWDEPEVTARLTALVAAEMAQVRGSAPPTGFEAVMPLRNNVLGLIRYAGRWTNRVSGRP